MSNSKYIPIILTLILILSSITIISAEETPSQTLYVSISGNDTFDGLTPHNSKRTVVNAVASAKDGDIIQIAPGTYVEKDITIRKNLTLRGADPTTTIIQGKGKNRSVIFVKYNGDVLVQKLTITPHKNKKYSRGIMNYGFLTVEDSIITGHICDSGGAGICSQRSAVLTLRNCTITNNSANLDAGGIFNSQGIVLIEDSVISNNKARDWGGGIVNGYGGSLTLRRSVVSDNEVYASFGMGYFRGLGGGIISDGRTIIQDSLITGNKANYGGGYYGFSQKYGISNLFLYNSTISNNKARINGGGIYIAKRGHITLRNSVIIDNKPNNGYKGT